MFVFSLMYRILSSHPFVSMQPLDIESVPLVRHLLDDVKAANEAREVAETKLETMQHEALELSQILRPLRNENAQLLQENNTVGRTKTSQGT